MVVVARVCMDSVPRWCGVQARVWPTSSRLFMSKTEVVESGAQPQAARCLCVESVVGAVGIIMGVSFVGADVGAPVI